MAYSPLKFDSVPDRDCRHAFERANMYLRDVYGMFRGLPPAGGDGGGGNYSMALVLTCVIDGLSSLQWPLVGQVKKRFLDWIYDNLWWSAEWMDKDRAAEQIYYEFRNMLVHELAVDRATSWRPKGYAEPVAGRWGEIRHDMRDIAMIDGLDRWNDDWPILYDWRDSQGKPCFKLCVASLYWAVKQAAKAMIANAHKSAR